ncbi:unnamed protein product [Urochloa decumbens]|uniref:DUF1618 domain-containing protein n=1 Tax=Urochloa decumbens TaxID=240449 RepID=A0ABC8VD68_9POAL
METLMTNRTAPSDPPPARPPWVMLKPGVNNKVDSDSAVADAKTRAASCTSSGQSFSISFELAAPPATSSCYCDWIGGALGSGSGSGSDDGRRHRLCPDIDQSKNLSIIAAHDDSLLLKMGLPDVRDGFRYTNKYDYFLYETGGAARPPSLWLLPGCYVSKQVHRKEVARKVPTRSDRPRSLHNGDAGDTGVLRCGHGEGEFLVAQLEVIYQDGGGPHDTAEICVFRPGGGDWELKQLPIVHHEEGKLPWWPNLDTAVPVGTRFMCWVDYVNGFFMCDMVESTAGSPKVQYVPLPVPPPEQRHRNSDRPYLANCRNLAAAGTDAVRFMSIAPRCCCGGPGKTECESSRFAFNVTTWTLTLRTEGPMTWMKDGVLDCDELWQLTNYGRLPRVVPRYPIMSSENPDIVCFLVREENNLVDDDADKTEWMLRIDTRTKELLSAVRGDKYMYIDSRVRAKLRWQLGN